MNNKTDSKKWSKEKFLNITTDVLFGIYTNLCAYTLTPRVKLDDTPVEESKSRWKMYLSSEGQILIPSTSDSQKGR